MPEARAERGDLHDDIPVAAATALEDSPTVLVLSHGAVG